MPPRIDLAGQRFGRLTVVSLTHVKHHAFWLCHCDCGGVIIARSDTLKNGNTASCGCIWREAIEASNSVHGHKRRGYRSPTYISWENMIARCTNPKHNRWHCYGGIGIGIDDPRLFHFDNFLLDMGVRPAGTSLDRINPNLGYSKANCRWATPKEQANNQRRHRRS